MMRLTIGYPSAEAEKAMLDTHGAGDATASLQPVAAAQEVAATIQTVAALHAADPLKTYVVDVVRATREHPSVDLGCSPRAALSLLRASRAAAAIAGRDYVVPDDIKGLAAAVLSHRLILTPDATMTTSAEAVIGDVIARVPIPAR